jgi:serine phosphatase RsbU (regulator of sigma subunit)
VTFAHIRLVVQRLILMAQNTARTLLVCVALCIVHSDVAAQGKAAEIDSLIIITKSGRDTSKVRAYSELCRLFRSSDTERAIAFGQLGSALAVKIGFKDGEAVCRQSLANALIVSSAYAKAMKQLLLANAINVELGDQRREAACLSNMAIIHLNMGNLGRSVEFHAKALEIREHLDDSIGIANSLNNLGVLYTELNNPQQALANYTASLEIKKRLGLNDRLGVNLNNIAICYQNLNDTAKALEHFLLSLENYRQYEDIEGEAMVLGNLGNLYFLDGKLEESRLNHLLAVERHRELGNIEGMCLQHLSLVDWYIGQKDMATAYAHADTALRQAVHIQSVKLERDAHLRLSQWYELRGKTSLSLSHLKDHLRLNEQLQMEATSQQMAELQTRLETARIEGELQLVKAENQLNIERILFEKKVARITMALLLLSLLLVALAAYAYWRKRKDNRILAEKNAIIEQKNTAITQSIRYAKRIQNAVLTTETAVRNVFKDPLLIFRPKDIVSGDFFWAASQDNWDYAAVADCTGHGVPGAFVSILGHTELAAALNHSSDPHPQKMLERLNERIRLALRNEESNEVSDGLDIALCALHRSTGRLEFCGAIRPMAIVSKQRSLHPHSNVTAHGDVFLHLIPGSRRPVGKTDRDTAFESVTVQLRSGDRVYLFSDGYADQFGGAEDKKFGNRAFRELLLSSSTMPMAQQQQLLESKLQEWTGSTAQTDDICILGFSF